MSFDFVENFTLQLPDLSESNLSFSESFNSKHGLIVEIAAIHEGLTSNYNHYSAEELEKALQSWVEPYPKPIILNHDLNTEPIGRVMAARMERESEGTSYVRLQVAITDPVAAQKVLDKRYLTGSVGGRAEQAICSITCEDLAVEDESGRPRALKYKRGRVYKGKLAYVDMKNISFKEYSFVNQPADSKSGVRSTLDPKGADVANSDTWVAKSSAFVLNMESEDIVNAENNASILEGMKKKESKPLYLSLKGAFLTALAVHESENDINNSESLLSGEDFEHRNPEENPSMENDGLKDEDILAVATGLSEDLSHIAAAATAEEATEEAESKDVEGATEEQATEAEETAEEAVEEAEETSDEVSENTSDDSSSETEESEVQDSVDSDDTAKEEEVSPEEGDETQEEAGQDELSSNTEELEQAIEQLEAKVSLLEEENIKLKKALHMTLVERVVDTKIGLGYESLDDREKLIAEHEGRTASSLADTLRDLAKTPAAKTAGTAGMPEVSAESEVLAEENVVTVGEESVKETVSPDQSFEQLLVDALMGRRKL
jgi:hypothetical protein